MKRYLPVILTLPFFILLTRLINRDFYYDEMYSLVHYILVPITTTTGEYSTLNNHFFYSAINNVLMTGRSLHWILEHPWYIRIPQVACVITTIIYVYKIGREQYTRRIAIVAANIMITSLPFYYYAVQIRGYGLSVMFATMLLYYSRRAI